MNESLLKKEFKESDIQRVRNLVNKDYTSSTKAQSGYQKTHQHHKEGDIWEESGKTWTIKNGVKQNITKLDKAKKAAFIPLTCPKCEGSMKHHLAKKMYRIHGFCFDCTIEYESDLKKAGLYEQYEKQMLKGNLKEFAKEIENWIKESLEDSISMVTEQGDLENWGDISKKEKNKILKNLNDYLKVIKDNTE
tara:strand:- start:3077 stop:3652 length:576 start_codon:yes stop_codon:yes gene_type:complete